MEDEADQPILDRSQKNRQRVAPGLLLDKVAELTETYGIHVVRVNNSFIGRKHNDDVCNHINPPSRDRLIQCEACSKIYDQDENACRNMMAVQMIADLCRRNHGDGSVTPTPANAEA